ncbi:MAG TPA: hypothetical protein GX513_04285, partial [Firmicutes bacterium]|nr:hypothetical protein [Bacillota bacterium]
MPNYQEKGDRQHVAGKAKSFAPGATVPAGLPDRKAWLGQHFCHFYYGMGHLAVNAGSYLAAGLLNGEM